MARALQRNQELEAQLEAARPKKRRKVEMSPNSKSVNIEAIRKVQLEAEGIEIDTAEKSDSNSPFNEDDCIVVAT